MALPGDGRPARRPRRHRPVGLDRDAHLRRPARPGLLPARLHDGDRGAHRALRRRRTRVGPRAICGSSGVTSCRSCVRRSSSRPRSSRSSRSRIQSGLEFLGLGDTSVPTWGGMLNDAFSKIYQAPLLMLWPSLAIGADQHRADAARQRDARRAGAHRRGAPQASPCRHHPHRFGRRGHDGLERHRPRRRGRHRHPRRRHDPARRRRSGRGPLVPRSS